MAIRLPDRLSLLEQRLARPDAGPRYFGIEPERALLIFQEGLRVMDPDSPDAELMRQGIADVQKELEAAHEPC